MTHVFESRQEVPAPLAEVFAFFSEASNLPRLTPPALGFRMLTPGPVRMAEGTVVDYRIRLLVVPWRWRARISKWNPPREFHDEQLRGPYRTWVHRHEFAAIDVRRTLVSDHVTFSLPLPPLGEIGLPLVRLMVRRVFDYRRQALEQIFPG